jgi:hypothetical protein
MDMGNPVRRIAQSFQSGGIVASKFTKGQCGSPDDYWAWRLSGNGWVPITRVNQVWSTDITYIRLHGGFVYLVAVMDWFRRYVLSWAVSITMDVGFCLEASEHALGVARPEIFHIPSNYVVEWSSLIENLLR